MNDELRLKQVVKIHVVTKILDSGQLGENIADCCNCKSVKLLYNKNKKKMKNY